MKRRISLVIALVLSFLMMFSSIARAEDIKLKIPSQTSESADLEIVIKVPPVKTNKVVDSQPQEKASDQVLSQGEQINKTQENNCTFSGPCGECEVGGDPGQWFDLVTFDRYALRTCLECF